jgi:hypothetical protein
VRHAQAYWQKLLAEKVISRANEPDMSQFFDPKNVGDITSFSDADLIDAWDNLMTHQAQMLCASEIVLREKVRREI